MTCDLLTFRVNTQEYSLGCRQQYWVASAELAGVQSGSLKCLDGQDTQISHENRIKEDPLGACWEHQYLLGCGIPSHWEWEGKESYKCFSMRQSLYVSLPKPMFSGQFFHQSRGDICQRLESLLIGLTGDGGGEVLTLSGWSPGMLLTFLQSPRWQTLLGPKCQQCWGSGKPSLNPNECILDINELIYKTERDPQT